MWGNQNLSVYPLWGLQKKEALKWVLCIIFDTNSSKNTGKQPKVVALLFLRFIAPEGISRINHFDCASSKFAYLFSLL